ncbi:MAG TPA: hypothetical protein DCS07_09075 [Bdellovibrionales bacterium]|nr:MAG: hypothetical protein A2Z97_12685 [Bdellovibrionales bacterium GWB1_52_6]OFZ02860.1 MAG: hypothetical protein A2X97_04615 [Bdellovibrionales bacterium GWA1_52_35]OFZ40240.1 MAG: hypothetical protein A2070_10445 [Bdellovibrionales bacterium GWC1_52_8]HAR42762.1 hypothetical protein [Bdellovibrionales bacterium]HCM38441.1 hypothetical protein [Bdellovibrionales bacterium]
MKKISFITATLMVIMNLLSAQSTLANSYPNAIAPLEAKRLLDQGSAVLIDIREKSEIALGMAAPALWYPKSTIDADLEGFLAFLATHSGKEIILYCRSGNRVSAVIKMLTPRGIHAWNMGGFAAWVDARLPTKIPQFAY